MPENRLAYIAENLRLRGRTLERSIAETELTITSHSILAIPSLIQARLGSGCKFLHSSLSPFDRCTELIQHAKLIIWDEVPMANKAVLACDDETLQKKLWILLSLLVAKTSFLLETFAGDFCQTCPVVQGGNQICTVDASISSSSLWPLFHIYRLQAPFRNA